MKLPPDFDEETRQIFNAANRFTMTSPAGVAALVEAVRYVVANGVLILDDYGYWQGARKAVDEYFAAYGIRPLMGRVDFAGRMILKP